MSWLAQGADGQSSTWAKAPRRPNRSCAKCSSAAAADLADDLAFERKLFVIRRRAENAIRYAGLPGGEFFYVPSLSSRTFIYKGMLTSRQVSTFYPDLSDP